jgi:energy-coupling factor transport system permease protein
VIAMRVELEQRALDSPLGRTSPVAKLAVALGWLMALAFTLDARPAIVVAVLVLAAGATLGSVPPRRLAAGLAPLWLAALSIGVFNAVFSRSNGDASAAVALVIGPVRITGPALAAGAGLAARVVAIAAVGVVFAQTTDSTRLVDALVEQAHVSDRFAYGALAAYQAIPRLAAQLTTLRQARRIRGLRGGWHPRLLVGLLVLAIRHGDRLALAMDARGFGSGPRSRYREVRWTRLDGGVVAGALVVLALAALSGRG